MICEKVYWRGIFFFSFFFLAGGRAMVMLAVMAPRVPATAANGSERRRRDMGEIELPRRAGKWLSRAARGTVSKPVNELGASVVIKGSKAAGPLLDPVDEGST